MDTPKTHQGDRQRALRVDPATDKWIDQEMKETGKTFTNIVKEALLVYRLNNQRNKL